MSADVGIKGPLLAEDAGRDEARYTELDAALDETGELQCVLGLLELILAVSEVETAGTSGIEWHDKGLSSEASSIRVVFNVVNHDVGLAACEAVGCGGVPRRLWRVGFLETRRGP